MSGKSLIALALLLALLFAGSPSSPEGHVHETYDDAFHCALCSFASSAVALAGQPVRVPAALARTNKIRPPSQQVPAQHKPAANRTRGPPAHFS
jgi:hypothetical protein